jgi:hypothetical protein
MNTDIVKSESFCGKTARVIDSPIGKVVPVVDLIELLGYSRSAIDKARKEHEGKMSPCETFMTFPTSGGPQPFLCLNRTGVDYLLIFIHPSKARMSDDAFLDFRRDILTKMEIVQVPAAPFIYEELDRARLLAKVTGGNLAAFQKIALGKCGYGDYAPALDATPTIVHGEPGWHNATQLGEMCGLNAEQVNAYLYNKGFQYREGKIWRLNPSGEMHGKEYVFEATSGHREIRIRWRESILYASGLKRPIDESQLALPARA